MAAPILEGFFGAASRYMGERRALAAREKENQLQQEQRLFETLLQSPNEEAQAIGLTGLQNLFSGRKTGFLDKILGRAGENPAYAEAQALLKQFGGPPGAGAREVPTERGTRVPGPPVSDFDLPMLPGGQVGDAAPAPPARATLPRTPVQGIPPVAPPPVGGAALPSTTPVTGGEINLAPGVPPGPPASTGAPSGPPASATPPSPQSTPVGPTSAPAAPPPIAAAPGPPGALPGGVSRATPDESAADAIGNHLRTAQRQYEILTGVTRESTITKRSSLFGKTGDVTPATAAWDKGFDAYFDNYMKYAVKMDAEGEKGTHKTAKQIMDDQMVNAVMKWTANPEGPFTPQEKRYIELFKIDKGLTVKPADAAKRSEIEEFQVTEAKRREAEKDQNKAEKTAADAEAEKAAIEGDARAAYANQNLDLVPAKRRGKVQRYMDAKGWVIYPKIIRDDRINMEKTNQSLLDLVEDVEKYKAIDAVKDPIQKGLAGFKFNANINAISRLVGRQKGEKGAFATKDAADFQAFMRGVPSIFGNAAALLFPDKVIENLRQIQQRATGAQAKAELAWKAQAGAAELFSSLKAPRKGTRVLFDSQSGPFAQFYGRFGSWDGEAWDIPDEE